MKCLTVGDHCDACTYNLHALQLNQIEIVRIKNLKKIDQNEQNPIILCHKLWSSLESFSEKWHCIVTGPVNFPAPKRVTYIQTPFTWHQLFSALSETIKMDPTDITDNGKPDPTTQIIGTSHAIEEVKQAVRRVSASDTTVLLLGESGTGKDLIASTIHELSPRRHGPFVPVNCGAIPADLLESELFGHIKGAFTGALTSRPGRFEIADNGTMFLDEIGDMPTSMQVKLLRVLQDHKIQRVGSNESKHVNVKIIAATNKNLSVLMKKRIFREDLFYRINVFPVNIPPLRERISDIRQISMFWMGKISKRTGCKIIFSEEAWEMIENYSWPGNIRELQNFLERTSIMHPDSVISPDNIKDYFISMQPKKTSYESKCRSADPIEEPELAT